MILKPEYGIDIIVLVKFDNEYSWYVSDKDYWVLDYDKWGELFISKDEIETSSVRKDFPIVDATNWIEYKKIINDWLVSLDQLNQMILGNLPIHSWDEKGELFPSLFVDFDQRKLYSLFSESLTLESLVPDNWIGKYDDFYNLIPQSQKYWIIDGVDYFPKN
jgi:hypothetical protein